ncbi:hypothetical protein FQN52_003356 [Onygenales sp. PD_12]|nr:hypothetical protein FQN52_003356 [Onygenales sp. PD_12]
MQTTKSTMLSRAQVALEGGGGEEGYSFWSTNLGPDFEAVPIDQYSGKWIFLNTTYWDFGNRDTTDIDRNSLVQMALTQSQHGFGQGAPLRGALGHPLANYSPAEGFLMDYFVRGIAPFCSLSSKKNPYLELVTPLGLNFHEPVRNILLAIAANQLQLLGNRTYEREAYIYKQKALHGLQNEINAREPSPGAVATVLMLCFHDITDGCSPSWTTHLRGGLQLLEHMSQEYTESQMLKRFFVMYFVAHDIMARTAVEDISSVEQVDHSWLEDDNLEEIDILMGCSRGLMTLIGKISSLAMEKSKITKTRPLSLHETSFFNTARNNLEISLHALQQTLPSCASPQGDLERIAETKRLSALLYLRERLGNPTSPCHICPAELRYHQHNNIHNHPSSTRQTITRYPHNRNNINNNRNRSPTTPTAVDTSSTAWKARIVNLIVSHISTLPDSPTLLWPLFIVGNVDLDDEGHRRFVLERLASIQKTRNLGSVRRARMVVEAAYRAKDIDFPRGKSWGEGEAGVISLA